MSRFLLCGWGPVQWHFDGESAGSAPPKPPDQKNDANYQACDAQHRQQNASCGATGYDAGALGNEDSLGDWSRKSNAIFTRRSMNSNPKAKVTGTPLTRREREFAISRFK